LIIQPEVTLRTLAKLQNVTLQSQSTFRAVLHLLSELNREYSRAENEIECDICLRIPEDPVRFCGRATCSRMVCKNCADEYINSAAYLDGDRICFWCRTTNCPPYYVNEADHHLVDDSKNKEARLRAAACRLMEFYIFDFCLSSHTGQNIILDGLLISDLIHLLAKRPLPMQDGEESYTIDVVPSDAARVTLLRSFLDLRDEASQQLVQKLLVEQLELSVSETNYLDTPLSICYSSVHEQLLEQKITNLTDASAVLDVLDEKHLFYSLSSSDSLPVKTILDSMATLRRVIDLFADAISTSLLAESQSMVGEEKEKEVDNSVELKVLVDIQNKLERFLAQSRTGGRVRTLRMFLLKNLERRRGVSFLRSVLQLSPFKEAKWVRDWKATGEVGLTRFLGSNKLPQNNPFLQFPFWERVHTAVSAGLTPTSNTFTALETVITDVIQSPTGEQMIKGSLLLALFQESFLLQVLPEIPQVMQDRLTALRQWINTASVLRFLSDYERKLLLFFAVGSSTDCDAKVASFLALSNASSPEHISLVRVLAHLCATAMSSPGTDHMAFFRSLIASPQELKGSFFPCMPEDITAMAVRVLGGRWYKCVNGHAYYVDACGRPTIIQKCATCGVDIGGTNHNPLPGQLDLDEKLEGNTEYSQVTKLDGKSDPLYCFREAKQESDPFDVPRLFTPLGNRTVRFLLHASLILGAVAHGSQWDTLVRPMLNPTYSNPTNIAESFIEHLTQDFGIIKRILRKSDDDTALAIHILLEKTRGEEKKSQVTEEQLKMLQEKIDEKEQSGQSDVAALLRGQLDTLTGRVQLSQEEINGAQPILPQEGLRNAWEKGFNDRFLGPVLNEDGINERLEAAQKRFSNSSDDDDGVFVAELLERNDIEGMRLDIREECCPALFRYRRPFSYQDFVWQFNMNQSNKDTYIILDEFIKDEQQLRALQYLPQLIQWQSLLLQRYNRRLDRNVASETPVHQILREIGNNSKWSTAFEGFANAWNQSWPFVKRFGCVTIPQVYKDVEMNLSTPISFSLASEKDEGICPLSLSQFLGQKHNHFVERVDELMLMRGNEMQRSTARHHEISSKFFTTAHALSYNLEDEFLPFVEKQCVQISPNGDAVYDFKAAEQYLLDVYFMGKPLVELTVRMIQYSGAESAAAAGLREKVKQEFLTKETESKILAELGSQSAARTCLELLDTCISFLMAAGDSSLRLDVGDMSLGQYVRSVLCMEDVEFGSVSVTTMVKLKHMDCLRKLLRDYTVVDPLAGVRSKYRAPLEEKERELLTKAAATLDLTILVPLLKEMMIDHLSEDHLSATQGIKEVAGMLVHEESDAYLSDMPWFEAFPSHLPMGQIFSVYEMLSQLQQI
jgi:hypothetical protein